MLIAYIDETYEKSVEFAVIALVLPADALGDLEESLNEIMRSVSTTHKQLSKTTELHGYEIASGEESWKNIPLRLRTKKCGTNTSTRCSFQFDFPVSKTILNLESRVLSLRHTHKPPKPQVSVSYAFSWVRKPHCIFLKLSGECTVPLLLVDCNCFRLTVQ